MKIEEAIEILTHPPFYPNTPSDKGYASAIKLGIGALKEIRRLTEAQHCHRPMTLPGETEE